MPQHTPATTGLVGMAMLASGSKPGEGRYGAEIQKAIEFTLSCVQEDGVIGIKPNGMLYVHAYALRFLAEAQLASASERKKTAITKAVGLLVTCQNDFGGWRYTKNSKDADSSATSCILIALATARKAGVEVPQETFDRAIKFLKSCQTPDGGFGYVSARTKSGGPRSAAVVSALCLSELNDDQVDAGFGYLSGNLSPAKTAEPFYFYRQYHLANAMRFASDEQFRSWHGPITRQLLKTQLPDGSWSQKSTEFEYPTAQACLVLLSRRGER